MADEAAAVLLGFVTVGGNDWLSDHTRPEAEVVGSADPAPPAGAPLRCLVNGPLNRDVAVGAMKTGDEEG